MTRAAALSYLGARGALLLPEPDYVRQACLRAWERGDKYELTAWAALRPGRG